MKLDNIFKVIGRNFKFFGKLGVYLNLLKYTVGAIILHIPLLVVVGIVFAPFLNVEFEAPIWSTPLIIIVSAVYAIYNGALYPLFSLKLAEKSELSMKDIFIKAFHKIPDMFVMVFVGSFVLGVSSLLLFVPAIILLVIYGFSPFLLVEEDLGAFKAFKRSAQITKGHRLMLFVWMFLFFLVNTFVPSLLIEVHEILGYIAAIVLGLLQIFVTVDYYYQLKGEDEGTALPDQPEQTEPSPAQMMNQEKAPPMVEELPGAPQQQEAIQNLA